VCVCVCVCCVCAIRSMFFVSIDPSNSCSVGSIGDEVRELLRRNARPLDEVCEARDTIAILVCTFVC
jgi:hypothetical protein